MCLESHNKNLVTIQTYRVPDDCPRVLINREQTGTIDENRFLGLLEKLGTHSNFDLGTASFGRGMNFKSDRNRDIAVLGDCDDGVRKLAKALGWEEDFNKLCQKKSDERKSHAQSSSAGATTS